MGDDLEGKPLRTRRWLAWGMTFGKIAFPVAIIAFLLWRMTPEQWEQLRSQPKRYPLLAAALGLALAAISLSFARWCLLVRCQGIRLSLLQAFRLGAIGYLLSFVSVGSVGGDLFKALFLARRSPGKRVEAVASVLVDRGSGLFGLLILVTVSLNLIRPAATGDDAAQLQSVSWAAVVLLAIGTTLVSVLILGGRGVDRWVQWLERLRGVGPMVRRFAEPLRAFHQHPWGFLLSVLMSVAVQSMFAVSVAMICYGLYGPAASPPRLIEHFAIVPVGMVASTLPIAPAGIGVFEGAIEWMYSVVPEQPTQASGTLVALVFEVVKIVMAVLGVIFYWTAGREVRGSLDDGGVVEAWVDHDQHR